MNLILHIGIEKTGTTSIQNALHANGEILGNAGYYLPLSIGGRNPRDIATYAMRHGREDDVFTKGAPSKAEKGSIDQEIRGRFNREMDSLPSAVHTVLISCEQLHSRLFYLDEVEKLRELLADRFTSVKVVVYLRPQAALAASLYTTALWYKTTLSFEVFMENHQQKNPKYYNFMDLLDRWEAVFGAENMVVRRFARSEFPEGNVVHDFIEYGLQRPELIGDFEEAPLRNESLSVAGQQLLRLYNSVSILKESSRTSLRIRRVVRHALIRWFSGSGQKPSEHHIQRYEEAYSEGNERVRKRYFPSLTHLFDVYNNEP